MGCRWNRWRGHHEKDLPFFLREKLHELAHVELQVQRRRLERAYFSYVQIIESGWIYLEKDLPLVEGLQVVGGYYALS